jgi:ribosomal protein S18 acetylase RimI-like enzyme
MSVRLRPLRGDEFSAFAEGGKRQYAEDMVENGGFRPETAQTKAEHDFASILPDGLATEGHFIFAVEDPSSGERVGRLWFARRTVDVGDVAFVYDVTIDEHARGRGLGRAAMLALEQEVRAQGLDRISLNVFGGNAVARALYASLGYQEMHVWMSKDVGSPAKVPADDSEVM